MTGPTIGDIRVTGHCGPFYVRVNQNDDATVVTLEGELDIATAPALEDAMALACSHHGSDVVVDVSRLTFMDCTGLDVLVAAHGRLRNDARQGLAVRRASGIVRRLFEITQLTQLLDDRTELEIGRAHAGLSLDRLFVHYVALGGTASLGTMAAQLTGAADVLGDHQKDIAALAVNECLSDLGRRSHFLTYISDTRGERMTA